MVDDVLKVLIKLRYSGRFYNLHRCGMAVPGNRGLDGDCQKTPVANFQRQVGQVGRLYLLYPPLTSYALSHEALTPPGPNHFAAITGSGMIGGTML